MSEPKPKDKPFAISKWVVSEAYQRVKANDGAAGVDGESIKEFERGEAHPEQERFPARRHSVGCSLLPPAWHAAERIAGILGHRGINVSGRTILRWVQKFGPALSDEIRR